MAKAINHEQPSKSVFGLTEKKWCLINGGPAYVYEDVILHVIEVVQEIVNKKGVTWCLARMSDGSLVAAYWSARDHCWKRSRYGQCYFGDYYDRARWNA